MQRVATTVLSVVGAPSADDLRALAGRLGEAANIRAALPDGDAATLERAVTAWAAATRAHIPYLVHDADPLADVAAAWVDRWDGAGDVGRLEMAVEAVLQRWRARSLELPDYYLVVDAGALPPTTRHWFLGVLAGAAPHRVVVTGAAADEAGRAVRGLRAGRWWPDLDILLRNLDRRVPDALQIDSAQDDAATRLVQG